MFGTRFQSSTGPIGVDFGARGLKIVQLRRQSGQVRVQAAKCVDLPHESDAASASQALAEQVRDALASGEFSGKRCVVSPARDDVHSCSVRMPKLPEADLAQAVCWEAAERFGLERTEMEVDSIRLGDVHRASESREEILLVAATHDRLHSRLEPLLAAGLRPVAVDFAPVALARLHSMLCRRESDRERVRGVLEIGASGAMFIVLRGDQVALCKPIPIGGRDFDQSVADHLGIDLKTARELRAKRLESPAGAEKDDATERAVFESVRALLDRIVKETSLCLRYYGVTFRGRPPDPIILAGGDALEPRFGAMLTQVGKLEIVTDDPASPAAPLFAEFRERGPRGSGPPQRWAVAAGLSLRGMNLKSVRRSQQETSSSRRAA